MSKDYMKSRECVFICLCTCVFVHSLPIQALHEAISRVRFVCVCEFLYACVCVCGGGVHIGVFFSPGTLYILFLCAVVFCNVVCVCVCVCVCMCMCVCM